MPSMYNIFLFFFFETITLYHNSQWISQKHNYLFSKSNPKQKSKMVSYSTVKLKGIHLQTLKTVMRKYIKQKIDPKKKSTKTLIKWKYHFISLLIEKYETISAQTKENLSFFVFLSQYARFYTEAKKNNWINESNRPYT